MYNYKIRVLFYVTRIQSMFLSVALSTSDLYNLYRQGKRGEAAAFEDASRLP